jgi:aspartokinase
MALVVQKYGGSSVADAEGIRRVAKRIVATKHAGNQVVVVVSAMGDTTDELIDLANSVSPAPPGRELDMLLTSGERISMALLAMAIGALGMEARSFTGSQAGVITDDVHGRARIMAACGAKVLIPRCVEYARRYNLPIHVRSSFSDKIGTWVSGHAGDESEGAGMEQAIISGVAHDRSEGKITVVGVPDKVGAAAGIFGIVAEAGINIDMIVQNVSAISTGRTDISFTLPGADGQKTLETLRAAQEKIGFQDLLYDDRIGKVSLIGAGMRSHPGVSAKFFGALAQAGVNIQMITTSEIRISVVVSQGDVDVAVNATHRAFDLEADEVEAVVYGGTGR